MCRTQPPPGSERLRQEATLVGWLARLGLWVLPFARMRSFCDAWGPGGEPVPDLARRVGAAVDAAPRAVPSMTCLVKALTAHVLLRRRGLPSTIHLGMRPEAQVPRSAHAWVTSGGDVVVGGDVSGHVPLGTLTATEEPGSGQVRRGPPAACPGAASGRGRVRGRRAP